MTITGSLATINKAFAMISNKFEEVRYSKTVPIFFFEKLLKSWAQIGSDGGHLVSVDVHLGKKAHVCPIT